MIASALFLVSFGIAASFFPEEISGAMGITAAFPATILLQLAGALYLGFGMMNWMAKSILIGGIYARPLAMGNFMHFVVGCLALIKVSLHNSGSYYSWMATIFYLLFAVSFGIVAFTAPVKKV